MGKEVPDEDYQAWVALFDKAYASDHFREVQASKGLLPLDESGETFTATIKKQAEDLRALALETGLIQ